MGSIELHRILERHIIGQSHCHSHRVRSCCDGIQSLEGLKGDEGVVVKTVYRYVGRCNLEGTIDLINLDREINT